MQYINSLDRKKLTIASLFIAAVLLFFVNILSTLEIKSAQIDLTESGLFTLSDGTRKVIAQIDEPLTFRFYYSKAFGVVSPAHGNYEKRVRELLEHYASVSGGKIDVKFINPEPFSVEEDEAVKLGVQAIPLDQTGESGYFGLAATNSTDDRKNIPFFNPQREQFLEYDLTRIIFDLAKPKKKVIGLMTGLLLEADPMLQYKPWPIVEQIKQFFDIKSIDSDVSVIPEDIDVLLIIHPQVTEDKTLYAIDQFVMRGGRALIFVDPQNETARMTPRAPPGAGSSELKKLFDAWGIEYDSDKFVGDRVSSVRVQAQVKGRDVIADYLSWGVFSKRNLNQTDVVTAQLNSVNVASAGHLELKKGSSLKITPLLQTSIQSQLIDAKLVRGEIDPEAILKQYKSDNKKFTLAARFNGKVKSAFPKGPPPPEKDDKKKDDAADKDDDKKEKPLPPHLAESKEAINMIVIADSDMLTSRFWLRQQEFFGRQITVPVSNNADILVNSLDNLSGSGELIGLRSRGISVRPFYRIIDLQNSAEDKYRETEQQLTTKLEDLQKKLSGLKVDGKPGSKIILSSSQQKAFSQFRSEMLTVRKQLRDVQLALRKDIESLDTTLKIVNIWGMPLIVAVISIILAIVRRRRHNLQLAHD